MLDRPYSKRELRNLMENPIKSDKFYARIKKALSKYTRFSFRNTKNFSPAQKASITRAWQKYSKYAADESIGLKYSVIKITKKQRKELGQRYVISNKGAIIPSDAGTPKIPNKITKEKLLEKLVEIAIQKIKRKGPLDDNYNKLSQLYEHKDIFFSLFERAIVITRKRMILDIFFPLLEGELISDLVNTILIAFMPNSIHLAVNKSKGTTPYTPDSWEGYQETLIYMEKKARDEHDYNPFKGVHASWVIINDRIM